MGLPVRAQRGPGVPAGGRPAGLRVVVGGDRETNRGGPEAGPRDGAGALRLREGRLSGIRSAVR